MTEQIDAWYTLEKLFIVTDILEDEKYDLRKWRDVDKIIGKLNNVTGRVVKLDKENEQLKQQLADIDRLIYDLGHDEMRRQYEEIFKGDDVE